MSQSDTRVPHSARVYDYLLGGKDNYLADRQAGEFLLQAYPNLVFTLRANRAFLAAPCASWPRTLASGSSSISGSASRPQATRTRWHKPSPRTVGSST